MSRTETTCRGEAVKAPAPSATSRAASSTDSAAADARAADLLQVKGLGVSYRAFPRAGRGREAVPAVEDVSLSVGSGEFVGIVGESGSGKSTTVQAILGILPRAAQLDAGRIHYGTEDVTGLDDRRLARYHGTYVGYVPQDPTASLNPVKRIGRQVAEAITLHEPRVPAEELRARVEERLRLAGLPRPDRVARQYPHELSGGMRQRALIAIALASEPRLLIADEPTSALDVTVQKVILDHLSHLREELGLGVLLITHDLGVAAERADRLIVMHRGRIVETGPAGQIIHHPQAGYTRTLLAAAPSFHRSVRPPEGTDGDAGARTLLQLSGLTKTFSIVGEDRRKEIFTAVDDVSLSLRAGRTHAVVGESGAGKSTLARIAVGLERPDSGSIRFDGEELAGLRRKAWRPFHRRIQLVYQNPFGSLDPRFTVERLITEPLEAFGVGTAAERRRRAAELLEAVALEESYLGRMALSLSGGQRQRIAIARALALHPELIVLDEAVSALDVVVQDQILTLLRSLQERFGLTYLFITHDLGVVKLIADDITVMRAGRVVESGAAGRILREPREDYTRDLLGAAPGAGFPGRPAPARPVPGGQPARPQPERPSYAIPGSPAPPEPGEPFGDQNSAQ